MRLIIVLLLVFISGCTNTIKTTITSTPSNANIYSGATADSLKHSGEKTPLTIENTDIGAFFKPWFYQAKKEGYETSEVVFKEKTSGDRIVHFDLTPLSETASSEQTPSVNDQVDCASLTVSAAMTLYQHGHQYLDTDGDGIPCNEEGVKTYQATEHSPSHKVQQSIKTYTSPASSVRKLTCHWVNGYRRKDGSYVKGHERCRYRYEYK